MPKDTAQRSTRATARSKSKPILHPPLRIQPSPDVRHAANSAERTLNGCSVSEASVETGLEWMGEQSQGNADPEAFQCAFSLDDLREEYLKLVQLPGTVLKDFECDFGAFQVPAALIQSCSNAPTEQTHQETAAQPASLVSPKGFTIPDASGWQTFQAPHDIPFAAPSAISSSSRNSLHVATPSLLPGSKKKKPARRGTSGNPASRKRGGKYLNEAKGDPHDARIRSLAARNVKQGAIFINHNFTLAKNALFASTGWQGRQPPRLQQEEVLAAYEDQTINQYLANFHLVPFDLESRRPTMLLDSEQRLWLYRTSTWFYLRNRASAFCNAIDKLLCDVLQSEEEKDRHRNGSRGEHFPCIIGHYRQSAAQPHMALWHRQREKKVDEFLETPEVQKLIYAVSHILRMAFPGIAQRYEESARWHQMHHGISPLFGLFYNFCVNGVFTGQRRVHCRPHADSKNIVGVCGLLIYVLPGSKFNHKARSWLVIWEAGVIIELPPWVLVLYPSSLFYHFNVDIHEIEFVITEDGSWPTKDNSTPLVTEGDDCGRGSIVFFNEATMFHGPETGHDTLKKAHKAGHTGTVDAKESISKLFQVVS